MSFDEIYKTAIWIANISDEYGKKAKDVSKLFEAINEHYTIEETKNIIEKGFISREGERK